ncbi:lytic transglycosylase domain-containing protein [Amycolatopsis sp. lyj-108]|uniref:lytic transglycosylase domain-containing protein n=1 Tax=Amycolatopsis sp. lyj-108 TaxID=2789286 RepID=UPI00397D52EB
MPKHRPRQTDRLSARHRTAFALAGGALAVLPAVTASAGPDTPIAAPKPSVPQNQAAAWQPPAGTVPEIAVDGSLPEPPNPDPLIVPGGTGNVGGSFAPSGALGIPASMMKAYKNAADILAKELPGCHIDWALIASIGRIESNHARGGYVDAKGDTLEPIRGPQLNGAGPFAAIPDTDGGKYDGDTVWDRAVGPTQFIPSTWKGYASDGNGDGESNPNNIYDATLGSGRYLCSGGVDLTSEQTQRVAVYRYNHSLSYVDTVIRWAVAYRGGVATMPDSQVPVGAPDSQDVAAGTPGGQVPVPTLPGTPAPGTTTPPTPLPGTSQPPSSTTPPGSSSPSKPSSTPPSSTPPSSTPPSSTPPSSTPPSSTPPPSSTTTTPPPASTPAGDTGETSPTSTTTPPAP